MKLTSVALCLFICLNINAKIIKHEIIRHRASSFSLKNACKFMGFKHTLLAHAVNSLEIDCMGRNLDVTEFCQKKFGGNQDFLGGRVKDKKALCDRGEGVRLSLSCEGKNVGLCEAPASRGCGGLQKNYAINLSLVHSSSFRDRAGKQIINCYYTLPSPQLKL